MLLRRWQADAKLLPRGTESSEPLNCQEMHYLLPLITPKIHCGKPTALRIAPLFPQPLPNSVSLHSSCQPHPCFILPGLSSLMLSRAYSARTHPTFPTEG